MYLHRPNSNCNSSTIQYLNINGGYDLTMLKLLVSIIALLNLLRSADQANLSGKKYVTLKFTLIVNIFTSMGP